MIPRVDGYLMLPVILNVQSDESNHVEPIC